MKNFMDWRFNRLITPTIMQVVNGSILVLAVLAGCIMLLTGIYQLANGAEKLGTMALLGGLGVAIIIPVLSRLLHEIAIVTFRIASVSKDVSDLLALRGGNPAVPPSVAPPSFPPPIPPPLP